MTQAIPDTTAQLRARAGITANRAQTGSDIENPRDPERNAPKSVYLCTEAAGNITGQIIDSSGLPMALYSPRHVTRVIHKSAPWTLDELDALIPNSLTQGLVNPAPPPQPE